MTFTRCSITVFAMTVLACAPAAGPAAPLGPPPRDALARLATRTILFGHQSVGGNILDGLTRLSSAAGAGPRPRA